MKIQSLPVHLRAIADRVDIGHGDQNHQITATEVGRVQDLGGWSSGEKLLLEELKTFIESQSGPPPAGGQSVLRTRIGLATGPQNAELPEVGGESLQLHPEGYVVRGAQADAAAPTGRGEGAERIYQGGKALLSDGGVAALKGASLETQRGLADHSMQQYREALGQVRASTLSPIDAHKVRAGSAAALQAVFEATEDPELAAQAAGALLELGLQEPIEGLRARIFLNLEPHAEQLSPAAQAQLQELKASVLPTQPPYDKWFPNGDETFEVVHYAHPDSWGRGAAFDPIKRYAELGLEVVDRGTNDHGEQTWSLAGDVKREDGSTQKVHVTLVKSYEEVIRDMDDPDIHSIVYTGHSNLGGNISEAVRTGPEEKGEKLLYMKICRGQQNIFEVANKYPNAHLITTKKSSPSINRMDGVLGMIDGVVNRSSYREIHDDTDFRVNSEKWDKNYIYPDEQRRYEYSDLDLDGTPDLSRSGQDRFFDVLTREPELRRTDLQPIAETRPADEIDASAVMNGANFARTLVTYHHKKNYGPTPLAGIKGEQIEGAGWFEGSDEAVKITETTDQDGKPVFEVAVNKAFSNQSVYAIGGLIQYELTRHMASKDGEFSDKDKAFAALMTGEYLAYMYCSYQQADAIMGAIGERAGFGPISYDTVAQAIDADDHGYVTRGQVDALLELVR